MDNNLISNLEQSVSEYNMGHDPKRICWDCVRVYWVSGCVNKWQWCIKLNFNEPVLQYDWQILDSAFTLKRILLLKNYGMLIKKNPHALLHFNHSNTCQSLTPRYISRNILRRRAFFQTIAFPSTSKFTQQQEHAKRVVYPVLFSKKKNGE